MVLPPVTFTILSLLVAGLGLALAVLGLRVGSVNEEARRLQRYVVEPAAEAQPLHEPLAFRQAELQGTLRTRVLLPWVRALAGVLGRLTPARSIENLSRQLTMAGHPLGLGPREFYGLQLAFIVIGFWAAYSFWTGGERPAATNPAAAAQAAPASQSSRLLRLLGTVQILYFGTQFPKVWLRRRIRGRQNRLRRALPDALDMLSVCADAGLGFDQALQRVSERWKNPLGAEFGRVVAEMQMGVSRQQALRNLANRLDIGELSSFVAIIIQSDHLGMSITNTLRAQAEQMRIERRHRAQEEARKAPLKMLFPMIGLILPAMGAVIIGPVIPVINGLFDTLLSVGQ